MNLNENLGDVSSGPLFAPNNAPRDRAGGVIAARFGYLLQCALGEPCGELDLVQDIWRKARADRTLKLLVFSGSLPTPRARNVGLSSTSPAPLDEGVSANPIGGLRVPVDRNVLKVGFDLLLTLTLVPVTALRSPRLSELCCPPLPRTFPQYPVRLKEAVYIAELGAGAEEKALAVGRDNPVEPVDAIGSQEQTSPIVLL